MSDLTVENHGTIFLLRPNTHEGEAWIDHNIPPDAQTFGRAIAVEHRYIADIVNGAIADGLTVK